MKTMLVNAVVPENKEKGTEELSASASVQFAETLEEAKAAYGEEAVLTNAFANWRITLQSAIRSGLRRGESPDAIASRLASAKLGVASIGGKVDPEQAYLAMFASANPQKQAEMIAELKQRAAKAGK